MSTYRSFKLWLLGKFRSEKHAEREKAKQIANDRYPPGLVRDMNEMGPMVRRSAAAAQQRQFERELTDAEKLVGGMPKDVKPFGAARRDDERRLHVECRPDRTPERETALRDAAPKVREIAAKHSSRKVDEYGPGRTVAAPRIQPGWQGAHQRVGTPGHWEEHQRQRIDTSMPLTDPFNPLYVATPSPSPAYEPPAPTPSHHCSPQPSYDPPSPSPDTGGCSWDSPSPSPSPSSDW